MKERIIGIALILPAIVFLCDLYGCNRKIYPTVCMEDAIVCCLVAEREMIPYRLAVEPGQHVQCQWLIDEQWASMHEQDDMIQEARVDNFKPDVFIFDVKKYVNARY